MKLCKISIKDNVVLVPNRIQSDLWLRVGVSALALPCVVVPLYFGWALSLIFLLSAGALCEWCKICRTPLSMGFVLLVAFTIASQTLDHKAFGVLIVVLIFTARRYGLLFSLGSLYIYGGLLSFPLAFSHKASSLLWLLSFVWSCDISAYLIGKSLKGPKLAPSISPGKTWSGFIGGIAVPVLLFSGLMLFFHSSFSLSAGLVLIVLSFAAHMGDLLESKMKRHFGLKDSGCCFPGHGGLLDRLDSILLVGWALIVLKFLGIQIPF